jgi:PAS domain S-box-containing protein
VSDSSISHPFPVARAKAWLPVSDPRGDRVGALPDSVRSQVEETFESLLDPYVTLLAVRGDDGRIVDFEYAAANDLALRDNQTTRTQLIGARLLDLFPAHRDSGLFDMCVSTVEIGEPLIVDDFSYFNELAGERRHYDIRALKIGDMLSYSWRDVTEWHHTLENYRLLAENASDVVFRASADFVVEWVSPSVSQLLGSEPREVIGRSMVEMIHPDDLWRLVDNIATTGPGERSVAEVRVLNGDGIYRWVSIWGRVMADETGAVAGFIGSARDAEQDHAISLALTESETRYRMLAENSSDIVFQTDSEGIIQWVSPSAEQVFGWTVQDLVGISSTELVYEEDLVKVKALQDLAQLGEKTEVHETRYRTAGNEVLWMAVLAQPIFGDDGAIVAVVVSLRNCHAEVLARRALMTLSAGSRELVRAENEAELLYQMCRVATEEGGYQFAWYARKNDDVERSVTPVAMSLENRDYLDNVSSSWGEGPLGHGPMGRAIRLGTTVVVKDLRTDPGFAPWLNNALDHGFRSGVALPVRVGPEVDGALMVYAPERDGFDDFAVSALEDLVGELGYGLKRLRDFELLVKSQEDQALLTSAIEQSGEAVVISDPSTKILYANPAASRISGYSREELIGATPRILKSGLQTREFYEDMWASLKGGRVWSGVLVNRRKTGELYEEDTTISPVHAADGTLVAYVAVKHDLTLERRLEADLTREFDDRAAIVQVMREVRPLSTVQASAAVFCDAVIRLPNTDAACVLLRDSAGALMPVAASGTKVFDRFEGRAFLPERPERFAEILAGPVQLDMDPATWPVNPELIRAALDEGLCGVVLAPLRWQDELIGVLALGTKNALSSEAASSRFALFDELGSFAGTLFGEQASAHRHRTEMRKQIRDVIDVRRFHPVFQPFVDLASGAVVGYEALTRFDDGRSPLERFDEAHSVGLGSQLESTCVEAALEAASDLAPEIFLSVNFSPDALLDGHAKSVLEGNRRKIVVEITEHAKIEHYGAVRKAVDDIEGCLLAVDDTGAGYTSLSHILELRPDFVKLDISMVRDIDTNPARQAMVAGMCHFAAQSGSIIIAEGIETRGEADVLAKLGAELGRGGMLGQGYYFAKPEPFN